MSDRPFQRPGTSGAGEALSWPYERPEPDAPSDLAEPPSPSAPPPARVRTRWVVASGVVGFLVGGTVAALLSTWYFADDPPRAITLDAFPEYLVGLERADISAREAADTDALEQFTSEFEDQKSRFLFAHGTEGASVDYGQRFSLTLAAGSQSLPLPTRPEISSRVGPPTLVSLDTDLVSCVFEPRVGLYDGAVLNAPADLTAAGITDCVLNDFENHLSLRITSRVPGGADQTSAEFAGILERTHASLTR